MRSLLSRVILIAIVLPITTLLAPTPATAQHIGNTSFLVTASWLAQLGIDPGVVIVDTRAPDAYAQGHIPGAVNPVDIDPVQLHEHIRRQALVGSESTFDALFAAHHYLTSPHSAMLQPIPTLAYLAALAPGLYLGTSIFLLPLHSPVEVAEQVATLDILCGGRFLFGVGQGYRDAEFRSFGLDRRSRRPRLVEGIQLIRKLWAEDDVTFDGRFFRVNGVSIAPKPIQRPGPPILVGADTVQSVARVPAVGDHWIASRRHSKTLLREALPAYKAALERQGRTFKGLFLFRDLCMAESATQAAGPDQRCVRADVPAVSTVGPAGPGIRVDLR